jgi:cytochrome c oxidase subunit IV
VSEPSQPSPGAFASAREKRLWRFAAAWLLLIYASTCFLQFVLDYLRERNLLRVSLALLFATVGAALLARIARRRPGWRELGVLAAAAAAYLGLLASTKIVQERIHYLQYGLLSALFYRALGERWRNDGRLPAKARLYRHWPELAATALTAASGWVDEGIQALLPNRVYDLRDVGLNAFAGALAIATIVLRERARRRDDPTRE